ncbi:MAG: hypothetical protein Q9165_004559 [Trypethelium subeluteriae]
MASDLDVHVNGSMLTDAQRQEAFYNQILCLQDEVFAGTHPRIKLPPDVLAQHAYLQATTLPAQHPPTNGFVQGRSPSKTFDNSSGTVQDARKTPYINGNKAADGSVAFAHFSDGSFASGAKPPPTPGLDPIFLQKSEVTVKAEQQLKRQRIERSLKDQYDIRKQTAWSEKDGNVETAAPFDISETLQKAQLLVKHVSGLKLVADRSSSGSDAMHTNSYYSSQDNWSSQGSQQSSQGVITNKQQHAKSVGIPLTSTSTQQNQSQTKQLPRGEIRFHIFHLGETLFAQLLSHIRRFLNPAHHFFLKSRKTSKRASAKNQKSMSLPLPMNLVQLHQDKTGQQWITADVHTLIAFLRQCLLHQ